MQIGTNSSVDSLDPAGADMDPDNVAAPLDAAQTSRARPGSSRRTLDSRPPRIHRVGMLLPTLRPRNPCSGSRWAPRIRALLWATALATAMPAQKPGSAAAALQQFAAVEHAAEGDRRKAAGNLGDFPEPEVTAVLVRELRTATTLGYRIELLRAIGKQLRPDAIAPIVEVLVHADNPRLMDAAAQALARQQDAGVQALAEVLDTHPKRGPIRTAVLEGLGRSDLPRARAVLVREVERAAGRDRLPALRGLDRASGEPGIDALRVRLCRDDDVLVAATALGQLAVHQHAECAALALELHRRCREDATAEVQGAILHGLLLAPVSAHHQPILIRGARADDPFGPPREAAWTAALQDPALLRQCATAALQRKQSPELRFVATLLARAGTAADGIAADALGKLLQQPDPTVQRAAAAALTQRRETTAVPQLQALFDKGSAVAKTVALWALVQLDSDPKATDKRLRSATAAREPMVRAAALQLLAEHLPAVEPAAVLTVAGANLAHADWTVRAAAVGLLRASRQRDAVPLLFARVDAETARLRADVLGALFDLTRQRFPTTAAWVAWWQQEQSGFTVAPPLPREPIDPRGKGDPTRGDSDKAGRSRGTVTYWSLPVDSEAVAFVVDVSGSMNQPFGTGGSTRLDEAKRQLQRVLQGLPPGAKGNIVTFATEAKGLTERLQPFDPKHRAAAAAFAAEMTARGATNVHGALELAFADPAVDTIYLLTDGQPSAGPVVDGEALLALVRQWNLGRSVRIHTVALGGRSEFLARLAADSGGECVLAR